MLYSRVSVEEYLGGWIGAKEWNATEITPHNRSQARDFLGWGESLLWRGEGEEREIEPHREWESCL